MEIEEIKKRMNWLIKNQPKIQAFFEEILGLKE